MLTPGVKVPLPRRARRGGPAIALAGLVLALGATACGDAESAQDQASVRMIPPAEAEASPDPADRVPLAGAAEDGAGTEGTAGVEEGVAGAAASVSGSEAGPATRPYAVRRPEPSTVEEASRPASGAGEATPGRDDDAPIDRAPEEGALERTDPGPVTPARDLERGAERAYAPPTVPVGTRLSLIVETGLSTRESRAGDRFRAHLEDDVLGADGMVLLPRDATVRGRVLESRESQGSDRPAFLTLEVESVVVDGVSHGLRGTVEDVEMEAAARDGTGETAAKVGVGAAAGAILGKIIGGDSKDALKGAAVGAAAGAAVALATRDGHATIPEGARLVVRLDEPLVLAEGGTPGGRWR